MTIKLAKDSVVRKALSIERKNLLDHAAASIERILPHVSVSRWDEAGDLPSAARWGSNQRKEIRVCFRIPVGADSWRSLCTTVRRKQSSQADGTAALRTLDIEEHRLCDVIATRLANWIASPGLDEAALHALRDSFDEGVIAEYLGEKLGGESAVNTLLRQLHALSEQTYENSSIAFGCLLDPAGATTLEATFPDALLDTKKYRVLSDGYRTAYRFTASESPIVLEDLDEVEPSAGGTGYYPTWIRRLAARCTNGVIGVALSRQGDILVIQNRQLRLTYRYGQWQYWNHAHLVNLLRRLARAQHVPPTLIGRVVGTLYRSALDIAFRRSGGLLVLLRNRGKLRELVRKGDAIGDSGQTREDRLFGEFVASQRVQSLPRNVIADLAAVDGAIVMANSGQVLAYGAILSPKKKGHLRGSEGSRTKAAIGASNYGLAIKISADGGIAFFSEGKEFLKV